MIMQSLRLQPYTLLIYTLSTNALPHDANDPKVIILTFKIRQIQNQKQYATLLSKQSSSKLNDNPFSIQKLC
jgi:hypothetical protein